VLRVRDRKYAVNAGKDICIATHNTELAIIWPLLGRHIAFHRRLVDLTASVKAALLLSQTIYWTRHGRDIASNGGWFLKTTEQWAMETGLSAKEQTTARAVLCDLALIDERRLGMPAKLHFRLCVDQLGALLSDRISKASGDLDWDDGVAVAQLLGPSLAYHRTLAASGGGVHAGLLLSRALHLMRLQSKRQQDGWVSRTAIQWTEETGLTRREQETARRSLRLAGLWEEVLTGIPPRLLVRIRLDGLLARLAGSERAHVGRIAASSFPDGGIPASRFPQKGATGWRESRSLVSPKAPNQLHRIGHDSSAESANPYVQRSTGDSVQPLHNSPENSNERFSQCGGELIFPETFLPEERAAAILLVRHCAGQAQALLDELSARMQAKSVHTSPIAYLRGLIRRAEAGEFVPELGLRVAAARQRHHEESILRQQRAAEAQRLAAEQATPEHRRMAAKRRAEIREMLEAMRAGQKWRKPA